MNPLEPDELVVVGIDTEGEEQARVAAVHELVVTELRVDGSAPVPFAHHHISLRPSRAKEDITHLDKVGLVLLISRRDHSVHLPPHAHLLVVL